jgi:hypothetical protein
LSALPVSAITGAGVKERGLLLRGIYKTIFMLYNFVNWQVIARFLAIGKKIYGSWLRGIYKTNITLYNLVTWQ